MARRDMMTEEELRNIVDQKIQMCESYVDGDISAEREKGIKYYYSDPLGNEVTGRSSFVTSDVQNVVESVMPDLMEIFAAGGAPVEFNPKGREDKPLAEQMTAACAYVWYEQNEGFINTYDILKDGLLCKNGFAAIQWVEDDQVDTTTLTDVNSLALSELQADRRLKIVEFEEKEVPPEIAHLVPDGVLYDVKVEKRAPKGTGKVCVETIPPENMLISPRSTGYDKQPDIGAKFEKTVSELIEEGYDEETVKSIPAHNETQASGTTERLARYRSTAAQQTDTAKQDDLTRKVWVYHMFLHADFDGDGRAEYRQVTLAGPERKTVLYNEAVDDHIFVDMSPIRNPHMVIGRSYADLVIPFQLQHSTLWRQLFDNLFGVNNNRAFVNERVNLDDYLTNRPGGAIRVVGQGPVGDAYAPVPVQSLGPTIIPAFEVLQSELESRTGETKYSQGLDAESLNKTMGGMNMILGQSQRRKLLVARLYAEGFKKAFKKIRDLLIQHQDRPMMIRLRGEYTEVDPRKWDANADLSVAVGLGHGTQQEKVAISLQTLGIAEKVIAFQGGLNGPFIGAPELYQHLEDFYRAGGKQNVDAYLRKPEGDPPQQAKKSETEIWAEVEKLKAQIKAMTDIEKAKIQHTADMTEIALEDERERARDQGEAVARGSELGAKVAGETAKLKQDAGKTMMEVALKSRELDIKENDQALKRTQLAVDAELGARKADTEDRKASQPKGPNK